VIEIRGGILSRRWAPEIILKLRAGPLKFNAMLNGIEGISDRILTERLRDLEAQGLAMRTVDAGPPVRVHYELTAAGRRYIAPLLELRRVERLLFVEEEAAVG
jgi:DNA-binding HxlR family transcriptional regulator